MGHRELPAAAACTGCAGDAPVAKALARLVYRIDNMDCPTEEGLIRQKLGGCGGREGA